MKKRILIAFALAILAAIVLYAQGAYSTRIAYNGSGYAEYVGTALPGTAEATAAWQIYKLTYDGSNNVTEKIYANGSEAFSFSWTLRASYTYSE